jgi:hypothetical protein
VNSGKLPMHDRQTSLTQIKVIFVWAGRKFSSAGANSAAPA